MVRRSVEASQVSTAAIRCDSSFFSLFLRIKIRPTHPDRQQPDSNLCTQFDMHAMANEEEHRGEGGAASAALVNDRSIGKDNKIKDHLLFPYKVTICSHGVTRSNFSTQEALMLSRCAIAYLV